MQKTPLKIFQVITRLNVGGAAIYNILLTAHLKNLGNEVWLITGRVSKNEGNILHYLGDQTMDFPHVDIPELGREISLWNDLIVLLKLIRLFRRERPDVVHVHTSKAGLLGRIAAWVARVPVRVYSIHGTIFNGLYFSGLKTRLFILFERILAKTTHCILTDTSMIREEVLSHGILPKHGVRVLSLGLNLEVFRQTPQFRGRIRDRLKIEKDVKVVGIIARLVPIKCVECFLEGARHIKEAFPNVRFVITGDGELRDDLKRKAKELGLGESVTFLGFWQDLREIYADLDVLVLSSLSEGCPVAILEGMAAGLPVVASTVGGVPDVIRHDENGLLFPPRDAVKLAESVVSLLQNPERAQRLATRAKKEVFERFTIEQSAAESEKVYLELFRSPARHRSRSLIGKKLILEQP